jgi:hypothetical protein
MEITKSESGQYVLNHQDMNTRGHSLASEMGILMRIARKVLYELSMARYKVAVNSYNEHDYRGRKKIATCENYVYQNALKVIRHSDKSRLIKGIANYENHQWVKHPNCLIQHPCPMWELHTSFK